MATKKSSKGSRKGKTKKKASRKAPRRASSKASEKTSSGASNKSWGKASKSRSQGSPTKQQAVQPTVPPAALSDAPPNGDAGKLRIRMYQVGFGDCFLVSIPSGAEHQHILIDCGVHAKGHIQDGNVDRMTKVVKHIAATTGGKLALVIATHAHQDHISGFGSEMATFETFEVSEVWLPWLEDPQDPAATRLRAKRMALAGALQKHFAATKPSPIVECMIVNATGLALDGSAAAGSSNAKALDLLQSGFHGKATVSYLKAPAEFNDAASIKGLNVKILAPSTDSSFLGKMDPPNGQHYLRLSGDDGRDSGDQTIVPFAHKWITSSAAQPGSVAFPAMEQKRVDDAVAVPPATLAFALDKVLNNTSVVGLFTFARQCMLFPGDAQWGNWLSWLDSASKLLANLTYYKVGHHCSVNATPRRAVEAMTGGDVAAMASTQNAPFPSIPDENLVAALRKQTGAQYIQSDWLSEKKPGGLPSKFRQGDFWIDYVP